MPVSERSNSVPSPSTPRRVQSAAVCQRQSAQRQHLPDRHDTVLATASDSCGNSTNCSFTVTVYAPTLTIQPVGTQIQITWPAGTLQEADEVTGPYVDMDPQPVSPYTFTPSGAQKFFRVRFGGPGFTYYDTEMLQLDISGGSLPGNMRLRESPTLASTGKTAIAPAPGGGFVVSSFFDVFTELSLDDGATWSPSTSAPPHMKFVGTVPSNTLPPKDSSYVSPSQWHALYAQGIYLTNASHLASWAASPCRHRGASPRCTLLAPL